MAVNHKMLVQFQSRSKCIAQLVEQLTFNQLVLGSSPSTRILFKTFLVKGSFSLIFLFLNCCDNKLDKKVEADKKADVGLKSALLKSKVLLCIFLSILLSFLWLYLQVKLFGF